jgi:hypothetical protein
MPGECASQRDLARARFYDQVCQAIIAYLRSHPGPQRIGVVAFALRSTFAADHRALVGEKGRKHETTLTNVVANIVSQHRRTFKSRRGDFSSGSAVEIELFPELYDREWKG